MADTSIAVTPGSGALIDARSVAGGDLQQAVVLGNGTDATIAPVDTAGLNVHAGKAATATLTNVTASVTSVQLLAANTARLGVVFYNDSTAILHLKFGVTASTTSKTVEIPNDDWLAIPGDMGILYTGRIDGIWDAANGACRITELS